MGLKIVPDIIREQDPRMLPSSISAQDAAIIMATRKIGAVMVVDDGHLVGICSERDITFKVVAKGLNPNKVMVREIMTANPVTIGPDQSPEAALQKMREIGSRHLPVVEGDQIHGILSIRDLYAAIAAKLEDDIRERDAFITGRSYSA